MKNVLVIDDSRVTQRMVKLILERQGYAVQTAGNGQVAIDLLKEKGEGAADLIICDINMPELDGFGFLEWVRGEPRWQDVPVIMLTAMGDEMSHETAEMLGANAVITQPFDSASLVETVGSYF